MAALEAGQFPATVWLLLGAGSLALGTDLLAARTGTLVELRSVAVHNMQVTFGMGQIDLVRLAELAAKLPLRAAASKARRAFNGGNLTMRISIPLIKY